MPENITLVPLADSHTDVPKGKRLCKLIKYKITPNGRESLGTVLPAFATEQWEAVFASPAVQQHLKTGLEHFQDGMVRDARAAAGSDTFVFDPSPEALISAIEAKTAPKGRRASGQRLNKKKIKEWFDSDVRTPLIDILESCDVEDSVKRTSIADSFLELFQRMADKDPMLSVDQHSQLLKFLKMVPGESEMSSVMAKRLAGYTPDDTLKEILG